MARQPLVYVLLLNFCSTADTLACVETVRSQTYSNVRLLVIDNASPDNGGAILREKLPHHEILQLSRNTGYAGGNNHGIRLALSAGADYVFIVNPDVRLTPQSISNYVEIMQKDGSISALNPIQLRADGCIDEIFRREMFDHNGYATPKLPMNGDSLWDVGTLFGAALFIDSRTIQKVGGFDPLYFAYWEEVDLCRRIRLHGGRLVVTSVSPVTHLRSYMARGRDSFRAFLRLKGMYLFRMKDSARPLFSQSCKAFSELIRRVFHPVANDFGWGRRDHLRTLWWLVCHLKQIRRHRISDKVGAAYLETQ